MDAEIKKNDWKSLNNPHVPINRKKILEFWRINRIINFFLIIVKKMKIIQSNTADVWICNIKILVFINYISFHLLLVLL